MSPKLLTELRIVLTKAKNCILPTGLILRELSIGCRLAVCGKRAALSEEALGQTQCQRAGKSTEDLCHRLGICEVGR